MLPNFICLGAQKCGTTTIWHMLNAHPDICMAQPRETRFFYDDLRFAEGLQQYEIQHFSHWAGQAAVGEKCPEYLYVPEVAHRIYDTLGPTIKFIVALRSPAQRAFSHYRHNLTMLRESRAFDDVLEAEHGQIQKGERVRVPYGYLARGYYAQQLKRYFDLFDPDQLLMINFERQIVTEQHALCDRLFDFLEIERFYPKGMPFKAGHPPLENLSIQINQNSEDAQQHFVEIERASYKIGRLHKLLRFLNKRKRVTRHKNSQRIYNPSESLIRFAYRFRENKPAATRLPRTEELQINRRYFRQEIEQLSALMPSVVKQWLET
jgi:hypothetical protein